MLFTVWHINSGTGGTHEEHATQSVHQQKKNYSAIQVSSVSGPGVEPCTSDHTEFFRVGSGTNAYYFPLILLCSILLNVMKEVLMKQLFGRIFIQTIHSLNIRVANISILTDMVI